MHRIKLNSELEFSGLVSGMWRLAEWGLSRRELAGFISRLLELGISTFDHADIYGNYSCETLFGEALALSPSFREKMQIVTKCGIRLVSAGRPENKLKYYDTGRVHIENSVDNSLRNLGTEYLDLLLIHRPDPFMDPAETAGTFVRLRESGKVRAFGVSNFAPRQFEMLESFLPFPLVTNQVEISPLCLNAFRDGTITQCQQKRIHPMAWSPLAGGRLFGDDSSTAVLRGVIADIMDETEADSPDQVILAWLIAHPAGIIPVVGSGRIERIESATKAAGLRLDRQQWFRILEAASGREVP